MASKKIDERPCPNKCGTKLSSAGKELIPGVYVTSSDLITSEPIATDKKKTENLKKTVSDDAEISKKDFRYFDTSRVHSGVSCKTNTLAVHPPHLHFGAVPIGQHMSKSFILSNMSTKPARFLIHSEDACLKADHKAGPLPPGLSRRIDVTFHAQLCQPFVGELTVRTEESSLQLTCSAKTIK